MINKIKGLLSAVKPKKLLPPVVGKSDLSEPEIKTQGYTVIKETQNTALVKDEKGNEIWIKK